MGDFLEYPDILQEVRGSMHQGRLKLQNDKIIFRNVKTGKVESYATSDIEKANWLIRARGYCLKLTLNNGNVHRYDGLKENEFDKLASYIKKNFSTTLEKRDLSLKGWNWGTVEFGGNNLDFHLDGKTAFEIPLNNVSHSTAGKNEVTLEFHQNDEAPVALMELRFHIPTDSNPEVDSVEEFHKNVMSQADVIQATGDAVAIFSEVHCLTPRGRYDVKIYPSFLQLHGKTFDYKIPYTTILRLFLLPHKDGRQMFFVISLDPPIKQGQTRYHFLIALFNKDVETTIELGLSEEAINEKYEGKLQKEMSGLEYEIVSRIMKTLVNRKITVPGNFIGHTGTQSIQCSYKAATGFLYPLERGFIFIHKPPMHIRFDEVASVNFARSSGNTRSFDFEVETRGGTVFTFVGVEKDEYGKLYDFVTQKKLRVKNVGGKFDSGGKVSYGSDDESDEAGHDAYLHRMKAEGKVRDEDDEDEDESTDDDYVAPESGSEVAEEYDTDAGSSNSSGSEGEVGADGEKKPKKKREKTKTIPEPGYGKPRKPKDQRKKSKNKDPNMPKRPMTSYFLWMNENREKIKTEFPDLSLPDFSRKAGELWKTVSSEDKAKYDEKNKKLKVDYDEAMKVYKQNLIDNPPPSSDEEDEGDKKKKKKSPKKMKASDGSPVKESKAGSGGSGFKSKEFIESADDDSGSDSDDKPLKKSKEKSKKKKEESSEAGSDSGSDAKSTPPKKRPKRGEGGGLVEDPNRPEFEGLPSDEEILSSPEASGSEGGGGKSGSERGGGKSASGSGSGSGSDDDE